MKKKTQAFTLIELMIVVALIGVVTAYGLPHLRSFPTNTGLTTNTNDLVAALQYARSTAINDQGRVVVCASSDSMSATPSCGGPGTPWHSGWIIFRDIDNNASISAGDTVLKVQPAVALKGITITPSPLNLTPTNIDDYVSFGPPAGEPVLTNGLNQSGLFKICYERDLSRVRGVELNFSGRISSTREVNPGCP